MDSWTFARRLQLRGQPRHHTAFQFKSLAGNLAREQENTSFSIRFSADSSINYAVGPRVRKERTDART